MMWLTTMSPESRRLIKVLPTDAERTAAVFDLPLGDNLQAALAYRRARSGVFSGRFGCKLIRASTEEHPLGAFHMRLAR